MAFQRLVLVLIALTIAQCSFQVPAQHLNSELVSEGACSVPPHIKITPWIMTPRQYFVRLGSKNFYYKLAEIFLGRPATSEQELNNGCQRMEFTPDPTLAGRFNSTIMGYGSGVLRDTCEVLGDMATIICNITHAGTSENDPPSMDPNRIVKAVHYILDTDNSSFQLVYNCFINALGLQSRSYKVVTTTTLLTLEQFDRVVPIIQGLGFDVNKIHVPNLYHCEPGQPVSRVVVHNPIVYSYATLPVGYKG